MMKAKKVLFITQEITPYVPESAMSLVGRKLPQAVQEKGREIRTFTPKWGNINERRNQLHEVIRLSGMNMIIDDTDHPLIIKVASIQAARMQVYFIDNDDYFHPRLMTTDENGVGGLGFTFQSYNADDFQGALKRCLRLYRENPEAFRALQKRDMEQDFSWDKPAQRYMTLFRQMMNG